jgi:Asp-tRNA(Asn)/Glu-tRNA(Gln) amidotransferase A subunit family amidase
MSDLDLAGLSIARAARALRAREFSPLELLDLYLARIARLEPRVNAYITVTGARARRARRATEELAAGGSKAGAAASPSR